MKIEIGKERPANFKEAWPSQFELFSHFSLACGVPGILCAITTVKGNGKPNVCFYSGVGFAGGGSEYYAVLPGLAGGHTAHNIARDREFVINYLGPSYFDACVATITGNSEDDDEFQSGGFTVEASKTVSVPRIAEAFLCIECTLHTVASNPHIVIGRVNHAAVSGDYAKGIDEKYGDRGFMLHIPDPFDLASGESKGGAVAVCKIIRELND